MFYMVYGFYQEMYGCLVECTGFFMVHGCFGRYWCKYRMYGCKSFLCHPPTSTNWVTKRTYRFLLLFFLYHCKLVSAGHD